MKYFGIILIIGVHCIYKNLLDANQDKNEQLVNNINDGLIDLGNTIIRKKILKMKIHIK